MNLPLSLVISQAAQAAIFWTVVAASTALWIAILVRWRQGKAVIPFARRRSVPWEGRDVLFVFLLYVLLPALLMSLLLPAFTHIPAENVAEKAFDEMTPEEQKEALAHPAERLLQSGEGGKIAIAIVAAVIVAPVVEELLFRLLLQGWLESLWNRRRRVLPLLRRPPYSWLPIVLTALVFALIHYRPPQKPAPLETVAFGFAVQIAAFSLVVIIAVAILRLAAGAKPADLGWQPEKFGSDAKLGLLALLAAVPLVLAIQKGVTWLVTEYKLGFALDPVPLFLLALVFGYLYHRTHRIGPSLVLHMAFNATSIMLVFLAK